MNNKKCIKMLLSAIKTEFSFFPSLGLVSKKNQGSHKDMNYQTFMKSFETFKPFFLEINEKLYKIKNFYDLKDIGKKYEDLMFYKTNGINTHKGLIFHSSIFIYCFLYAKENNLDLQDFIKQFCEPLRKMSLNSKSMELCEEFNLTHPIKMAYEGYQEVFDGLNYYRSLKHLKLNSNIELFLLLTFLTRKIDDTTLILKIGYEKSLEIKEELKSLEDQIKTKKITNRKLKEINDNFAKRNISPGGAADLLVLVLFLFNVNYF